MRPYPKSQMQPYARLRLHELQWNLLTLLCVFISHRLHLLFRFLRRTDQSEPIVHSIDSPLYTILSFLTAAMYKSNSQM